jgi:acetyl esterase/lipase
MFGVSVEKFEPKQRMKPLALILTLSLVFILRSTHAQTNIWQPSSGHTQIPIWPGTPPDPRPMKGPEFVHVSDGTVAGKTVLIAERVAVPTMTVYSPKRHNTGIAVLVFPGGGYQVLAMDLEGSEVCEWLAAHGITGVLLKYRVPGYKGYADSGFRKSGAYPDSPAALEDAQRTMGLVRLHAAEWHIDPDKIGVMGFSAGGHLVASISTHFDKRIYAAIDDADQQSCRPDFGVPIYPGHMQENTTNDFEINPYVSVTTNTPPQFIVQAENDPVDPVMNSLLYFMALKNAKVPAELHIFAQGGHAFGLRRTKMPVTEWPELMNRWLKTIGMLSQ